MDGSQDRTDRRLSENVTAAVAAIDGDRLEVEVLSGSWKGRKFPVRYRDGYAVGRKGVPTLAAEGMRPGSVVELERAITENDGLSVYRIEILRADPDDVTSIVFHEHLATLRPEDPDDDAPSPQVAVLLRDAAIPVLDIDAALEKAIQMMADFDEPGRPGFVLRVIDHELGVTAACCMPRHDVRGRKDATETVGLFRDSASHALDVMDAILERMRQPASLTYGELVPVALFPIAQERASRFAAQAANFQFTSEAGEPLFAEALVLANLDRHGKWRAAHLSPRLRNPRMVGIDYPERFKDDPF